LVIEVIDLCELVYITKHKLHNSAMSSAFRKGTFERLQIKPPIEEPVLQVEPTISKDFGR
jgi:hypothetical protein